MWSGCEVWRYKVAVTRRDSLTSLSQLIGSWQSETDRQTKEELGSLHTEPRGLRKIHTQERGPKKRGDT